MEAGVAAVVGERVLRQDVGEVEVPVVALGHALVLRDRLHGCGRTAGIQREFSGIYGGGEWRRRGRDGVREVWRSGGGVMGAVF